MKIRIKLQETVCYDQEIEIDEKHYEAIKHLSCDDVCCNERGYQIIEMYLDRSDVVDTTGEFRDIQIIEESKNSICAMAKNIKIY